MVLVVQVCNPQKTKAGESQFQGFPGLQDEFRIILNNLLRPYFNSINKIRAWNIDQWGNTCLPPPKPLVTFMVSVKKKNEPPYLPYLYSPTDLLQCA